MAMIIAACLATVCILLLSPLLTPCKGEPELEHDIPDVFKIFQNFPSVIIVYDVDQDGDLDCFSAERTELKYNPPQATYIVSVKGPKGHQARNFTYRLRPGPTPDIKLFTIDGDYDHEQQGRFIYTDYANCAVEEFPFENHQECVLWVNTDVKDNVPQNCVDEFQKKCGDGVMAYDEDSCSGVMQ